MCRSHLTPPLTAYNSNNASAAPPVESAVSALPLPRSRITRTFLRRAAAFPLAKAGTPRNPKWALNVPRAGALLRSRGPHAIAPQIHNVWDRASCPRCLALPALLSAGLTPETDPCCGFYAGARNSSSAQLQEESGCARNVCAGGAGGVVGEAALRVHHYVLPRGGKTYRKRGDAGGKRDELLEDVLDDEALRFEV